MLRVTDRYEINPHCCIRYASKWVAGITGLQFLEGDWFMTHYRPRLDYDYGYVWTADETMRALRSLENKRR